FLQEKINIMNALFHHEFKKYLNNIKLNLDYAKMEDPKYNELHSKIVGSMFMINGGITSVVGLITSLVTNSISFITAVIIIARVFMKTSGETNSFASLGVGLLYTLIIIGCITITVRNSKKESKEEFGLYKNCATNRYIDYYHFNYMEDDKAAKDIRIFNQRDLIIGEIRDKARKPWMNILIKRSRLIQRYFGSNIIIGAFIGGLTYVVIGLRALKGYISLGNVSQSYASTVILISSIQNLFVSMSQITSNNDYLKVLYEYIDLSSASSKGDMIPKEQSGWTIEFHNVSFKYPSMDEYALKNVSFQITSNSQTAIVGVNGSGKTTMIKLLCGFYQPQEGYITLNGIKIEDYNRDAYLELFSVVFQDFKIFAFPMGENVAASVHYDEKRVWDALKTAGLNEKAESLPNKLEQYLYKNVDVEGMDISGGEEQKLAIARAFYKDAPFIIFDEPTAALDPIAESEIYTKFNQIVGEKAAVFISHRLSSCRFCERIFVFDQGEIVQRGTHDDLLKDSNGKYYELWNAQAQ
ncbi:MAG TPA: ABC transporter ATP-binding protein, partial [Lachnospiraceae bacterium]|nr:ABC transporter ATP-binding protein [Lachnospiraceae bacterium]